MARVTSVCLQYFTIKMAEGIVPSSYSEGDTFYIAPEKLLPVEKFLPKPKGSEASKSPGSSRGSASASRGQAPSGRGGGRGGGAPQSGRGSGRGSGPPHFSRGGPRGRDSRGGRGGRGGSGNR